MLCRYFAANARRVLFVSRHEPTREWAKAHVPKLVAKTEFDYKQDLDTAMIAFAPTGRYILLKGRFDWTSLSNYVRSQDGSCNNWFCRMHGSAP